jgi:D-xylose transport system permease protein
MKDKLRALSMVIALVLIWIVFDRLTHGTFLQPRNISNLVRQMAVTGILASGMVLVLVLRHVDLSVGSLVAFLGTILAVANAQWGLTPLSALLLTIGAGALFGSVQGFLISYPKIPAFIVTLGGMLVFRGAAMWTTSNTTVPLDPSWLSDLGTAYLSSSQGLLAFAVVSIFLLLSYFLRARAYKALNVVRPINESLVTTFGVIAVSGIAIALFNNYNGIPVPVFLMLAIMAALTLVARRTVWGRQVYAMGGNPEAAYLSGVPVHSRSLLTFTLMGVLSAVAAVVLTARVGSASPDAGQLLELDAIASCVIGGTSLRGGRGTIFGALLGALVMESLNNGMSLANMEPFWQFVVKGAVLVAAVWMDLASQKQKEAYA